MPDERGALGERSDGLFFNESDNLLEPLSIELIEVNMVCAELTQCLSDITLIVEREVNMAHESSLNSAALTAST